ncbi:MarR family winged helix-turn-helix transcriptional regulator [Mariniluteicoccus flavus]
MGDFTNTPDPLGLVLAATGQLAMRGYSAALPDDVAPREVAVLSRVVGVGPLAQTELSSSLSIPGSRLVALIDQLVERGWVTRSIRPDDRRARFIEATDEGRAAFRGLVATSLAFDDRVRAGLTPADEAELRRLLAVVAANLGERADLGAMP